MNFAEKKEAYHQMQNEQHLEADRKLLAKKSPNDPALSTGVVDKERAQREILWALLDVASVKEITSNRHPELVSGSHSDQDIDIKNAARVKAIEKLLALDLEKASQPVMANLVRALGIVPINFKAATIRPILADFIANLPKIGEATTEERIPVVAELGKVNELVEENEQLKGELEEKELENEDLQEQLDAKDAELEDTAAELAEAKKKADTDPV